MRISDSSRTWALLLPAAAVACTPQGDSGDTRASAPADAADEAAPPPAAAARASRAPKTGVIDSLKEEYGVLRRAPAPEPQPSADGSPQAIPARVKEAMPRRALQTVTGEATFYANHFEGRRAHAHRVKRERGRTVGPFPAGNGPRRGEP